MISSKMGFNKKIIHSLRSNSQVIRRGLFFDLVTGDAAGFR